MRSLTEFIFFRQLPRNARYRDGKRHIKVVPVKLSYIKTNSEIKHVDCHFATSLVKYARELSSLFSDENVIFLSANNKTKMSLVLPVSKKPIAVLKHLKFRAKFRIVNFK